MQDGEEGKDAWGGVVETYRGHDIRGAGRGCSVEGRFHDDLQSARAAVDEIRRAEMAAERAHRRDLRLLGVLALVALAVGGVWWLLRDDPLPVNAHEEPVRGEARLACRDHIAARLHDPGTAQWGELTEWLATAPEDGEITVWPRYRARNTFGALVLSRDTCRVAVRPDGTVRVLSVTDFP